jgi:hypothetical protein
MSHFAEVDYDGTVLRVIVAEQDFIDSWAVGDPKRWVQTSYNGNIRKNYAGRGFKYDKERDCFIEPKPFNSWLLDEQTARWMPPKEMPKDVPHKWDEEKRDWIKIDFGAIK